MTSAKHCTCVLPDPDVAPQYGIPPRTFAAMRAEERAICPVCRPRYRTIVVDPPWRYANPGATKANAHRHYQTLSLEELTALRITDLADIQAHLWLWTTNALLAEGQPAHLLRTWGFSPLTIVTWCKQGPGVGHYLRNNTEHVILASRGKPMTPKDKPLSSWYIWPRRAHSQKPDAFYDLVQSVSLGPYIEVFARQQRLGWDTWGNEAFTAPGLLKPIR